MTTAEKICQTQRTAAWQQRGGGEDKITFCRRSRRRIECAKNPNNTQTTNQLLRICCCRRSFSRREVKQPSEKLQSDQIAVNHRAAHLKMLRSPLEVQVDAVSGKLVGNKVAESLHQSAVSRIPSQRTNHHHPALPQVRLLSQGPH